MGELGWHPFRNAERFDSGPVGEAPSLSTLDTPHPQLSPDARTAQRCFAELDWGALPGRPEPTSRLRDHGLLQFVQSVDGCLFRRTRW